MFIDFYKYHGDFRVVDKVLDGEHKTLEGKLRDNYNVITPIIEVANTVNEYNYCYVPSFNRYYYIHSVTVINRKLTRLELLCDFLMTFKESIYDSMATAEIQEKHKSYVNAGIKTTSRKIIEKVTFENPFSEMGSNVLVAIRAGVLQNE